MRPPQAKETTIYMYMTSEPWLETKSEKGEEEEKSKITEKMAGLFDKQADLYLDARPNYPSEWFSKLADLTDHHGLAWDAATGNGQAALAVADHYERVIATDVSESQLKLATPHPRIDYRHTPSPMSEDELVELIGGENSVDLITVAQAVHWFDLPKFYAVATRLLRKPGGIIAVWGYNDVLVTPEFDAVQYRFHAQTLPYWRYPNIQHIFDSYEALPFPFESVGMGSEGKPLKLEMPKTTSFEGIIRMFKSWSAIVTAKEKGVDLLPESLVRELETAWGGSDLVRPVVYKAFMIAGKVRVSI